MDTVKFDSKNVSMVAHRGVSGLEMENTAAAFVGAANRSYFGIECDIHVTLDKKLVVIHDSNTARVALDDIGITVEESNLADIRKVALKNFRGEARGDLIIPTLAEYIDICKRYGKACVIELKNRFENDDIRMLIDEINAIGYLDSVIFISFSWENMTDLRRLLPSQPMQFLCHDITEEVLARLDRFNMDVDVSQKHLTKEKIDAVHAHGRLINTWTVDDPERGAELALWGVDYITSNILE